MAVVRCELALARHQADMPVTTLFCADQVFFFPFPLFRDTGPVRAALRGGERGRGSCQQFRVRSGRCCHVLRQRSVRRPTTLTAPTATLQQILLNRCLNATCNHLIDPPPPATNLNLPSCSSTLQCSFCTTHMKHKTGARGFREPSERALSGKTAASAPPWRPHGEG